MPMFTKKPVTIEAVQVPPEGSYINTEAISIKMARALEQMTDNGGDGSLLIHTLEGDMIASPGDWIIMGIKGEIYPCKPDIFEATYDATTSPEA